MKHEQLIEEINAQITDNRVGMRCTMFDAAYTILKENNNLLGKIKTVLKTAGNDYESGAEDAWKLAIQIVSPRGNYMPAYIREKIFGITHPGDILYNFSGKEALEKVEAYKKKKTEEAEKPVIGDVVECTYKYNGFRKRKYKGIVRDVTDTHVFIMTKGCVHTTALCKSEFDIEKTGKHFDIQGMLDEIESEG